MNDDDEGGGYNSDEGKYGDEFNAFERAAPTHPWDIGYNIQDRREQALAAGDAMNPFLLKLNLAKPFFEDRPFAISTNEAENILKLVLSGKLPGVQYKNAPCLVLGYIASNGGINLDKLPNILIQFKTATAAPNSKLAQLLIKPPDIVRYARYLVKYSSGVVEDEDEDNFDSSSASQSQSSEPMELEEPEEEPEEESESDEDDDMYEV